MKKIVLILSVIFLFPVLALATSGACSGHGGVSCSSGSDSDGSVICNDGWRNSSVSYSSMVMCQGYSPTPTYRTEKVVAPKPAPTPIQKVAPLKEITKKLETKKTIEAPKTEIIPVVPQSQTVQEVPMPKKRGFWSHLFSFVF